MSDAGKKEEEEEKEKEEESKGSSHVAALTRVDVAATARVECCTAGRSCWRSTGDLREIALDLPEVRLRIARRMSQLPPRCLRAASELGRAGQQDWLLKGRRHDDVHFLFTVRAGHVSGRAAQLAAVPCGSHLRP